MQAGITKATLGGKLMFPSDYVAAIEFKGRDVTLTISRVTLEDLRIRGGAKERKPVLSFKETRKKLILNKTNAGTIADIHGSKAEDWVGKKITLYPTRTQCGRATVDCIRVRERVGASQPVEFEEPEPHDEQMQEDDWSNLIDETSAAGNAPSQSDGTAPGNTASGDSAGSGASVDPSSLNKSQIIDWIVRHAPEVLPLADAEKHAKGLVKLTSRDWDKLDADARGIYISKWQNESFSWPTPETADVT